MKTFIWTSEYTVYIANNIDVPSAKMFLRQKADQEKIDNWDKQEMEKAFQKDPIILSQYDSFILDHANE